MIQLLYLIYVVFWLLTFCLLMMIDEGNRSEYVNCLSGFWMTPTTATILYYVSKIIIVVLIALFWFVFWPIVMREVLSSE